MRRSASNRLAVEVDRTTAVLRGATSDEIFASAVGPDDDRLVNEGVALLSVLSRRVHGESRGDGINKQAIRAWTRAALARRSHFASRALAVGFIGTTEAINETTFVGARAPGSVSGLVDTGITMQRDPRITITVDVVPDGSPVFSISTTNVVSRLMLPRHGEPVEVRYDPDDHSRFVFRVKPRPLTDGSSVAG